MTFKQIMRLRFLRSIGTKLGREFKDQGRVYNVLETVQRYIFRNERGYYDIEGHALSFIQAIYRAMKDDANITSYSIKEVSDGYTITYTTADDPLCTSCTHIYGPRDVT